MNFAKNNFIFDDVLPPLVFFLIAINVWMVYSLAILPFVIVALWYHTLSTRALRSFVHNFTIDVLCALIITLLICNFLYSSTSLFVINVNHESATIYTLNFNSQLLNLYDTHVLNDEISILQKNHNVLFMKLPKSLEPTARTIAKAAPEAAIESAAARKIVAPSTASKLLPEIINVPKILSSTQMIAETEITKIDARHENTDLMNAHREIVALQDEQSRDLKAFEKFQNCVAVDKIHRTSNTLKLLSQLREESGKSLVLIHDIITCRTANGSFDLKCYLFEARHAEKHVVNFSTTKNAVPINCWLPHGASYNLIKSFSNHAGMAFSLEGLTPKDGNVYHSSFATHSDRLGNVKLSSSDVMGNPLHQYLAGPVVVQDWRGVRPSIIDANLIMNYMRQYVHRFDSVTCFDGNVIVLSSDVEQSKATLALIRALFFQIENTDVELVSRDLIYCSLKSLVLSNKINASEQQLQKIATAVTKAIEKLQR